MQHTLPMQGGGAKHSLSYWNTENNDDDDEYDEDDDNDDDDNADGDHTQNLRKCSFSLRYLERKLFATQNKWDYIPVFLINSLFPGASAAR